MHKHIKISLVSAVIIVICLLCSCEAVISAITVDLYDLNLLMFDYGDYIISENAVYNKTDQKFYKFDTSNDFLYKYKEDVEGVTNVHLYKIEVVENYLRRFYAVSRFDKDISAKYWEGEITYYTAYSDYSFDGSYVSSSQLNEISEANFYKLIEKNACADCSGFENLIEFYSSFQRENPDALELNPLEKTIWDFAKSKSYFDQFPYKIEGWVKRIGGKIYFTVSAYTKSMWKGGALAVQGLMSSGLYYIDETTLEITPIKEFGKKVKICAFDGENIIVYDDSSVFSLNLTSGERVDIFKSKEFGYSFNNKYFGVTLYDGYDTYYDIYDFSGNLIAHTEDLFEISIWDILSDW